MKVLLAGSSGLVGRAVCDLLRANGHDLRRLVRRPAANDSEVTWHPDLGEVPRDGVAWADAVISLNGAPLAKLPWTDPYRRQILRSRLGPTRLLAEAVATAAPAPRVWLSASATGVYGDRPGETLTEASPRGAGFLAGVVAAWEAATAPAASATRVVLARTGVVLGPAADVLVPLRRLARLGLAGPLGGGRQHWPWISLTDEARAIVHLVDSSDLTGPVNLVAPAPATAADVTLALAQALHRPHVVPTPAWALRLALADAARDLLLADQLVRPARLVDEGTFQFRNLDVTEVVRASLAATA